MYALEWPGMLSAGMGTVFYWLALSSSTNTLLQTAVARFTVPSLPEPFRQMESKFRPSGPTPFSGLCYIGLSMAYGVAGTALPAVTLLAFTTADWTGRAAVAAGAAGALLLSRWFAGEAVDRKFQKMGPVHPLADKRSLLYFYRIDGKLDKSDVAAGMVSIFGVVYGGGWHRGPANELSICDAALCAHGSHDCVGCWEQQLIFTTGGDFHVRRGRHRCAHRIRCRPCFPARAGGPITAHEGSGNDGTGPAPRWGPFSWPRRGRNPGARWTATGWGELIQKSRCSYSGSNRSAEFPAAASEQCTSAWESKKAGVRAIADPHWSSRRRPSLSWKWSPGA